MEKVLDRISESCDNETSNGDNPMTLAEYRFAQDQKIMERRYYEERRKHARACADAIIEQGERRKAARRIDDQ